MQLTKAMGAGVQIEGALDAFDSGNWAAVVTLAGAAEDMLPEIPEQPFWRTIRDHPGVPPNMPKREWIAMLNAERNWLKHAEEGPVGPVLTVTDRDAAYMILRALAKLPEWTDRMSEFKDMAMDRWFSAKK